MMFTEWRERARIHVAAVLLATQGQDLDYVFAELVAAYPFGVHNATAYDAWWRECIDQIVHQTRRDVLDAFERARAAGPLFDRRGKP